MKAKLLLTGSLIFFIFSVHAQDSNAPAFGKGLFNLVGKDSSWTMKIGTRMQFLTIAEWNNPEDGGLSSPEQNFLIRRARLKFDGYAYSPKLKYKIELGLSNRDISGGSAFTRNTPRYILDAVVMWNFAGNFELWAGQTKLPGNIERVISSGNLQQVDRSLVNSRFNIDRDVGFQLRHHFNISENFLIREKIALSQGEGRNVTQGNEGGHQYTGRLEFLPFGKFESKGDYSGSDLKREATPKLMFAVNYDINQDAVKTRSNLGSYMFNDTGLYETTINTFFFDGMFKYNGFSFMWEYANRDAEDPIAKNSDGTETGDVVWVGDGINLQGGYLLPSNWEVSGRYTNIKLDEGITGRSPESQYTLGLSKYIVGHKLKVQTDLSYLSVENGTDEVMFRLQLDVHF
ncbi:MAG: OprO/OprP family phosphate-selective porin [Muriicola sp.]|nr:OprO/OprP family phosphate-selective porin [Muriicola sp.]NNC62307.1 porin [Eudoraea sp.]NNK20381.1 porin [Flavobacteriaceae bacterium]NNK36796.1 porin [Eudoraea sp.]